MIERVDEAFELDDRLTVLGAKLAPGDHAPEFELPHEDPETKAISPVRLSDGAGTLRVLSVVPSIDTSVCSIQGKRWEELKRELPESATLLTISMDLPHAQSRWQAAEGVEHKAISAHKSEQFGIEYGVLIREWRELQRSIFVIDGDGVVRYAEYVKDQGSEVDFDAALAAIAGVAAQG